MKRLLFLSLSLCLLAFTVIYKEPRTINGIVTDAFGKPVTGASIQIKGTRNGTITDTAGFFSITVPDENAILIISALSFNVQEIAIAGKTNITAVMQPATALLEEVVITGYSQSLQGKVAGVTIRGARTTFAKRKGQYAPVEKKDYDGAYDEDVSWRYSNNFNTESYDHITENPYLKVNDNPLSTFSIDVDAASYSNVRRFINEGQLPPAGAVRIEEMINYFSYEYPQPKDEEPFSVNTEISTAPWNAKHKLVLIGLQGKKIPYDNLPASNLVFLVDVSGSMQDDRKLPLVQASLKLLADQLRPQDKVSIVVYAGNAGLVLPATSGANKTAIKDAVDKLEAGGSTAGGEGIKLAYKVAKQNFAKGGNNRVILCTDGDFNVGISSDDALERLIEEERKSGIFLTVLGYGMGNYQDSKMQKLADKGNGNHAYIDGLNEAKKVLVNEFGGTLFTIAKDVKLQVEFNPTKVQAYRLIGYENRMLAKEDFNNDKKDAGDMGSGHTVTALYEVIPVGVKDEALDSVDALRYQKTPSKQVAANYGNEIMNIKLRYKKPDGEVSKLLEHPLMDNLQDFMSTTSNFRFAAAVAEFGMLLRNSKYKGDGSFKLVTSLAKNAIGDDAQGYRREFLQMVENAALLQGNKETAQAE
ncbi:vWA domain-containing protein [Foetidibacter luteolus]|uniref:vWA domain-containing protein n=1 Tax=Foetidibacter luteolus TaxID=2608880 RepID=UPI00129A1DD1|nr:VWA domain-containing protein [Foetidibacter luteolus]